MEENASAGNFSTVPSPAAAAPGATGRGDFVIRIARDGVWYYRGLPIGRLPLVARFARPLRRDADGRCWLFTPAEGGHVDVDDVTFLAVAPDDVGSRSPVAPMLRTNLDEIVTAGAPHRSRIERLRAARPSPI